MSLAADRRGRVPFALVGVLLLVGASVYATGLADRASPAVERPAAETMDDVSRDTRPALRAAVRDAARDAMHDPVTDPAGTAAGRTLNSSDPFVDALRLRIAAAAREELSGVTRDRNGVSATVSLPAVDGSAASLRRAKRGIEVSPVDGGTSMAVTVRNLTVRAREGGRVVAQRRLNASLTVSTPVLELHKRTQRYEERLNRGALEGAGLSRGLTTRLTAVTMARGYGRYAGAPIQNVLGNRHVELSTNAALLAQQRAAFGRADPAGARAVDVATVRVGVLDVLGGRHGRAADWTKTVLNPNAVEGATADPGAGEFTPDPPDSPPITTAPAAAADEAYLDETDGLSAAAAGSYRVRSDLQTDVLARTSESKPAPELVDWTLQSERTSERTVVTPAAEAAAARSDRSGAVDAIREVTVRHIAERRWYRNGSFRTTTARWNETARVAVTVAVEYAPADAAPDRPTEPLFERGGALDSQNLAGTRERAAADLLDANGGIDAVAAGAATGETGAIQRETAVVGNRPDELPTWIAADLRGLRTAVANVSISIPREAVASGEANAPARLAAAVRDRHTALLDAPETYDGAADRARVAARAAYLDRVLAALDERAAAADERTRDYREELTDGATEGLSELVALGRAGTSEAAGSPGPTEDLARAGGGHDARTGDDGLAVTPDGSPAYLTLASVDREQVPSVPAGESVHPLTARTTNWVALPYGDAADGVVDTLLGGGERRVSLEAAAGTLIAADRTVEAEPAESAESEPGDGALASNRAALAAAVRDSVRDAERELCEAASAGAISRSDCRAAVVDARGRWPTLGQRARAMANGSYAGPFADALSARGVDAAAADDAAVRARVRLRELTAERETSVPAATTNRTASAVQELAREAARDQMSGAMENASQRVTRRLTGASRLPAGAPVAPPPYPWIASVNAWSVTVRGEYQRFAVRARGDSPDGGGAVVRYVRDGSVARLDADGDGEAERLGRNERVGFAASTTVVAAVPAGMPGIGDVDGNRDERSPGWPCPGGDETDEPCRDPEEPE